MLSPLDIQIEKGARKMTTKDQALQIIEVMTWNLEQLKAYISGAQIPEPPPEPEPPTPDPTKPTGLVRVTADSCYLRYLDHKNFGGGAVWGNYPRRSDNPHRDRFYSFRDDKILVYTDGNIRWGKFKGAQRGDGGNHGWKVCEGQYFRNKVGEFVHLATGHPDLYILCRDVEKL